MLLERIEAEIISSPLGHLVQITPLHFGLDLRVPSPNLPAPIAMSVRMSDGHWQFTDGGATGRTAADVWTEPIVSQVMFDHRVREVHIDGNVLGELVRDVGEDEQAGWRAFSDLLTVVVAVLRLHVERGRRAGGRE